MPNYDHDPFCYERWLKTLADILTPEELTQLKKWKSLHHAYDNAINNASLFSAEYHNSLNESIKTFLAYESRIKDTIADVFLAVPNPKELGQRWDAGRAKTKANEQEQAIIMLADFVTHQHKSLRDTIRNDAPNNVKETSESTQTNHNVTAQQTTYPPLQNNTSINPTRKPPKNVSKKNHPLNPDPFLEDSLF